MLTIAALLLQLPPLAAAPKSDLDALLVDARATLESAPAETIRLATGGLEVFGSELDERLVELAFLLGTAHQLEQRYPEADAAYVHALELARSFESSAFPEQILARRAYCLRMLGDYGGALDVLQRVMEFAVDRGDDVAVAETANELAILHFQRGETDLAIRSWRDALEAFESAGDLASVSFILGNLGVVHGDLGQNRQSVECIERSLELAEAHEGGASRPHNLVNLGDAYLGLGQHEHARNLIEEAIDEFERSGLEAELAAALGGLALVHEDLAEHAAALDLLLRAHEIHTRLNLDAERAGGLARIAQVLGSLERFSEAVDRSRESLELASGIESKQVEIRALTVLSESLQAIGDDQPALRHLQRARRLEAQVFTEESQREIDRLYAEFDAQRREQELAMQAAELDRRLLQRNALVVGALLLLTAAAAGWGVVLVRRRSHLALQSAFGSVQASNAELVAREAELRNALSRITRLEGLLPICAECKSIRDRGGSWHQLEEFLAGCSDVRFSHGFCPTCAEQLREGAASPLPAPAPERPPAG